VGGFTPPPAGEYGARAATPTSTEAILALVLGILGFTTACFPLGFVGFYLGARARKQARELGEPSSTNATLGLVGMILGGVFGVLYALFWLVYAAIIVIAVVAGASSP